MDTWRMRGSVTDLITLQLKGGSCSRIIRRIYFPLDLRQSTRIELKMRHLRQIDALTSQSCSLTEAQSAISTSKRRLRVHLLIMRRLEDRSLKLCTRFRARLAMCMSGCTNKHFTNKRHSGRSKIWRSSKSSVRKWAIRLQLISTPGLQSTEETPICHLDTVLETDFTSRELRHESRN